MGISYKESFKLILLKYFIKKKKKQGVIRISIHLYQKKKKWNFIAVVTSCIAQK